GRCFGTPPPGPGFVPSGGGGVKGGRETNCPKSLRVHDLGRQSSFPPPAPASPLCDVPPRTGGPLAEPDLPASPTGHARNDGTSWAAGALASTIPKGSGPPATLRLPRRNGG